VGPERVRVPRLRGAAAIRVNEAMPLYNRVATGRDSARNVGRTALQTIRAGAVEAKEARTLYVQARRRRPFDKVGARIKALDGLIRELELESAPVTRPSCSGGSARIRRRCRCTGRRRTARRRRPSRRAKALLTGAVNTCGRKAR
jgi:hypothetical protein